MQSLTEKTTQAQYSYETAGELRCRYHDGRTRRAVLVLVTRLDTQARYSVLLPVDGHGATCSCPFFERKLKGTAAAAVGCKRVIHRDRPTWAGLEAVERLARELRAAVAKAEGD